MKILCLFMIYNSNSFDVINILEISEGLFFFTKLKTNIHFSSLEVVYICKVCNL